MVVKFERTQNIPLETYLKIKDIKSYFAQKPIKTIIKNLIMLELSNHDFKKIKPNIWAKENVIVDFNSKSILNKNNKKLACIEINNNFLLTKTLRNLINLIFPPGLTDFQIGKHLANSFLSAGIQISQDNFVILSQRILKKYKVS